MNRKLIIPFILLMFYSCKNAPHEVILSQVQELYGRNIVFTHNDHYVLNGRDTIIKQTNDYKIVMYSDSLGCQECELKLGDWRLKIKELKLLGKAVDFIFIIQSSIIVLSNTWHQRIYLTFLSYTIKKENSLNKINFPVINDIIRFY